MFRDSPLIALVRDSLGMALAQKEFSWTVGMRSLKIDIEFDRRASNGEAVVLQVSTRDAVVDSLISGPAITVLSVWSSPVSLTANSMVEDFVERRLDIGGPEYLSIWEETRESIARHIW